jgi:hypothetical protein
VSSIQFQKPSFSFCKTGTLSRTAVTEGRADVAVEDGFELRPPFLALGPSDQPIDDVRNLYAE